MYKTTKMCTALVFWWQSESRRDVTRIDGHSGRVPRRVSITSIQRRNEGRGERQIRLFETRVSFGELLGSVALLAIQDEEALRGECRYNEKCYGKWRD